MLHLRANPMYQATNITALNTGLIHTESGDCADSEDMHLSDAHKKAAQGEPCTALSATSSRQPFCWRVLKNASAVSSAFACSSSDIAAAETCCTSEAFCWVTLSI